MDNIDIFELEAFIQQMQNTFRPDDYAKMLMTEEDIGVLRKVLEGMIEDWKKERMPVAEFGKENPEIVIKRLEDESRLLVDIAVLCSILSGRIEYERYKLSPNARTIYSEHFPENVPMDVNTSFKYFISLMRETFPYDQMKNELSTNNIENIRKKIEQEVEYWKRDYQVEPFESLKSLDPEAVEAGLGEESLMLADIVNRCAILYTAVSNEEMRLYLALKERNG